MPSSAIPYIIHRVFSLLSATGKHKKNRHKLYIYACLVEEQKEDICYPFYQGKLIG